jgi:hypothetical protein
MYYPETMIMTAAGPVMSSYAAYYGGIMGGMRYGYGPNYGLGATGGYGGWYSNPYGYMMGSYW